MQTRTDRFGVEVRERVMWDIREGVVGADTFIPKHVVIITWKNMSFAGGIDTSLYKVRLTNITCVFFYSFFFAHGERCRLKSFHHVQFHEIGRVAGKSIIFRMTL